MGIFQTSSLTSFAVPSLPQSRHSSSVQQQQASASGKRGDFSVRFAEDVVDNERANVAATSKSPVKSVLFILVNLFSY
jgi:hypothetical protein